MAPVFCTTFHDVYPMIKDLLKSTAASLGYDIFKRDARNHQELCAKILAEKNGINTILDVGANTGQYAKSLRSWGWRGKIVSFEPLGSAHAALCDAAEGDRDWVVAPRCAIGSARTRTQINVSANSVSSSLADMLEAHVEAAPGSAYLGKEEVEVIPLDSLIDDLCKPDETFFLKIDTQGYEEEVLAGATRVLDRCGAVQLELSLKPLYSGGLLLDAGLSRMKSMGFQPFAIFNAFFNKETAETYQVDMVFVRN